MSTSEPRPHDHPQHRADLDDTRVQPRPAPGPAGPEPRERYDDHGRHDGAEGAHRPSERPTTDPHGPGTTFFTNHPDDVLARERDAYGGIKVGSAFFGWLSAVGLIALLLGLLSGAGAAFGLAEPGAVEEAVGSVAVDAATIGVVSLVALALVLFLAYLAGGYVAGRMARFDGAKQGVGVWLWALVVAVVVAVLGVVAGDRFDVLAQVDAFPRIPLNEGDLTTTGIVAAVVAALVALAGAVVGGLLGARYHRKVDRVGLLEPPTTRA